MLRRYWRRELLPLLADLKVAIGLLLAIAIGSALGTVLEQDEPASFYQANYPEQPALFGFLTWRVILRLGLDHVYRTPWFLALLIFFGASLAACTSTRQWPMLKVARRWHYYSRPQSFEKLSLHQVVASDLDTLEARLKSKGYATFRQDDKLYARKGLVGKIGPIIVHASMLLILAGAVWGSITGFTAQALIPDGSRDGIQALVKRGSQAELPDWAIQVNRFWIDYGSDGHIKQFYSDLSIIDNGEATKRETIFVNQPMRYKGVMIYQTDWQIAAVTVRINNSPPLQLPVVRVPSEGQPLWGTFVPTQPDLSAGATMLIPDLQGTVLLYGMDGQMIGSLRQGQSLAIGDKQLYLDAIIGSTGLQLKRDPGIPLVYAGFGLLMLGVVMSYVSHSQIWALATDAGLHIGGKTNRAIVTFAREFETVAASLPQGLPVPTY